MTGTQSASDWIRRVMSLASTFVGSPTKPRSTSCSIMLSGSRRVRLVFSTVRSPASLPDRPTPRTSASLPATVIQCAISLFTAPERTISATCMVSASVTRRPSTKSDFTPALVSMALICGPPPCTTTGFTPISFSNTTSAANWRATASSPMAWPPYLMTTVSRS